MRVALDDHVRRGGDRDALAAVAPEVGVVDPHVLRGDAILVAPDVDEVAVHVAHMDVVELDAVDTLHAEAVLRLLLDVVRALARCRPSDWRRAR